VTPARRTCHNSRRCAVSAAAMKTNTAPPAPAEPLALDPLGPIAPRPTPPEGTRVPAIPLDIDPLGPIPAARLAGGL
jgi:hypothetical protein